MSYLSVYPCRYIQISQKILAAINTLLLMNLNTLLLMNIQIIPNDCFYEKNASMNIMYIQFYSFGWIVQQYQILEVKLLTLNVCTFYILIDCDTLPSKKAVLTKLQPADCKLLFLPCPAALNSNRCREITVLVLIHISVTERLNFFHVFTQINIYTNSSILDLYWAIIS